MKITLSATVFILMIVASATMTFAQPPGGGPGGPGGRHGGGPGGQGGGAHPGRAVLEALDTDGNHEISGAEMQNAATALSKLDTNGDGKLNQKDLAGGRGKQAGRQRSGQRGGQRGRPQGGPPRGERDDSSRPPRGERESGSDRPERGGGPPKPERMLQQAMEFDADSDGKLDKTELQKFFSQLGPPPRHGGGGGSSDRSSRPSRPPSE